MTELIRYDWRVVVERDAIPVKLDSNPDHNGLFDAVRSLKGYTIYAHADANGIVGIDLRESRQLHYLALSSLSGRAGYKGRAFYRRW